MFHKKKHHQEAVPAQEAPLTVFPSQLSFWTGGAFRLLGSGIRFYKIVFVNVKVYELAFFAEDSTCVSSLQSLKAQGFFRDVSDQTCCAALSAGRFKKMLVFHLLRSVTREQFVDRLGEDLRPRLQQTGDEGLLQPFVAYFNDKQFEAGTQVLMLWTEEGVLEGGVFSPSQHDFTHVQPTLRMPSENFCKAMFSIYLEPTTMVPDARQQWITSVRRIIGAQ
ncbi:hypothetical protein WJX84_006727 [Apatococcus fuscideae]|uniref:Chalcone-flavonone isomerase family protein n=1 Tax=Apatococcus fuscideae TaxID=2026836 RepID=A0AAW1T5M2_9CHLO